MTDTPDSELLAQFARNNSGAAFAALVERHLALVHSVALRHTANPQHAQDIAQAVFIILARKAGTLGRTTVLPGWLYHTARLTAANFQRAETRRVRREQEVFMQSTLTESAPDAVWRELSPQLDEAMAHLGRADRDALVLRYFQNKSLAEVGLALGLAERAAQKRVGRALEKLRKFFGKRGVSLSTATIAGAVAANSVQAAPPVMAKTIAAVAGAKGAAAGTSTLTLVKGALKIMAWTKAKTALVAGTCVLLVAGTTTVTIKEMQEHQGYSWQRIDFKFSEVILKTPPQVRIVPTKFPAHAGKLAVESEGGHRSIGISVPLGQIIQRAFGVEHPDRMVLPPDLPPGKYDYIANLPNGSMEALQKMIEERFNLSARNISAETNVLLLQVKQPGAPGLKPSGPGIASSDIGNGYFSAKGGGMDLLAAQLENSYFHIPVLDQTSLAGRYDFDFGWDQTNLDTLKQALQDKLGLELVPAEMPVEILVVERTR